MKKSLEDFLQNTEYKKEKENNIINSTDDFASFLTNFIFKENKKESSTTLESKQIENRDYMKFINEFWTSKQRKASSIHEVSYRACFKPQLPSFFIKSLTQKKDTVYDPFSGRGTTVIEAGRLGRKIIQNDINPLSGLLIYPRFFIPKMQEIKERLEEIQIEEKHENELDLSMFYHEQTLQEIFSIKNYLIAKEEEKTLDHIDSWIQMVATNRLTGHSTGFFSVYTLPPNQAVSPESQIKINEKRNQIPPYRNTKEIILKKTKSLLKNVNTQDVKNLRKAGEEGIFLTKNADSTDEIKNESVRLTVTSPPFLDVVQYAKDNWLRCWFNNIDVKKVEQGITMSKTIEDWSNKMNSVFKELYRITRSGGWVAFEVGEVRKGKYNLDEYIVPIGIKQGFVCAGILINDQEFTKTANIWGIDNNKRGTNTNRIAIFQKN